MKKIVILFLLISIYLSGFGQLRLSDKQMLVGAGMTVAGAGCLIGSGFCLARGFVLLDDEDLIAPAVGLVGGGCILLSAGIALGVAGPIVIGNAVKTAKEEKESKAYLRFSPINNKLLNKYQSSLNSKKIISLSFVF